MRISVLRLFCPRSDPSDKTPSSIPPFFEMIEEITRGADDWATEPRGRQAFRQSHIVIKGKKGDKGQVFPPAEMGLPVNTFSFSFVHFPQAIIEQSIHYRVGILGIIEKGTTSQNVPQIPINVQNKAGNGQIISSFLQILQEGVIFNEDGQELDMKRPQFLNQKQDKIFAQTGFTVRQYGQSSSLQQS